MDRQHIEQELRRQGVNLNNMSPVEYESLVATRWREVQATGTSRSHPVAPGIRSREPLPPAEEVQQPPELIVRAVRPRPSLPPTGTPERELRDRLREAQTEYRARIHEAAEAKVLAEQATARLADAHAELAAHDGLDDRLATHEVESLRKRDNDTRLPYPLQRQLDERSRARDRCDRALAAQRRVQEQLNEATEHAAEARAALDVALSAVALAEARKLLDKLDDAEARVQRLRCRLAALQLPGALPKPEDVSHRPFAPLTPVAPAAEDRAAWTSLLAALRRDAAAKLEQQA